MDRDLWAAAAGPEPQSLGTALADAHEAAQVAAAAAGALARARPDDSHRALAWEGRLGALVGEPLPAAGGARVGVRLDDLSLIVVDGEAVAHEVGLVGRTRDEAYARLTTTLAERTGGAVALSPPEFEIPPSPVGAGAPWTDAGGAARAAVGALYAAAAGTLEHLAQQRDDASPVRCWPHHFDIATLLTLREGGEDDMRTIGVGMAPMGGGYDHWYLYVNLWPYPDPDGLPALDAGAWHTEGWIGAVLTGAEVHAAGAGAGAAVDAFVSPAVAAATRILEG